MYNPWKMVVTLPIVILLEGLHVMCALGTYIDEQILEPLADDLDDWMRI